MQPALLQKHSTPTPQTVRADGKLVRRSAIAGGVAYTIIVIAMVIRAPELRMFAPMWVLWTIVMAGAVVTYAAGDRLGRRTGGQSKRMRRWIDTQRS